MVWIAAGMFAALVVVVYAAARWNLRWVCVDGFAHWRKECDGHEVRVVQPENPMVEWVEKGSPDGGDVPPEMSSDGEDALDDAWAATLHNTPSDLREDASRHENGDPLGLDSLSWRDRGEVERWDWGQRMAAEQDVKREQHVAERREFRLSMGLEWRDEMGLAA